MGKVEYRLTGEDIQALNEKFDTERMREYIDWHRPVTGPQRAIDMQPRTGHMGIHGYPQVYAKMAKESYKHMSKRDDVDDWSYLPGLSTIMTSVFQKGDRFAIVHRGTQLDSDSRANDLKSDMSILFGSQKNDAQFIRRKRETRQAIQRIRERIPESKFVLIGHSLGGSTAIHALEDPEIDNAVSEVHTFNPGVSPLANMRKPRNASKITNHIIQGDAISNHGILYGRVNHIVPAYHQDLGKKVIKNALEINIPPILVETLYTHSIENFL